MDLGGCCTSNSRIAEAMALEFACGDELAVTLDGEDITAQLGLVTTGDAASKIAALPAVRSVLLQKTTRFQTSPQAWLPMAGIWALWCSLKPPPRQSVFNRKSR